MSLLNNDRKTNLLFREFVGTANALLPVNSNFTNEPLKNINFVFNSEIRNQEVPIELPVFLRIQALDACGNIASDSSYNLSPHGYPQLTFYKDIPLDPVPGAASQVWFKKNDPNLQVNQDNNLLKGMIPFKFDDKNVNDPTYLPIVKYNTSSSGTPNFVTTGAPNQTPFFWIQNANNGLIQFYAQTTVLNGNNIEDIQDTSGNQDINKAPKLSFYKYTGTFGAGGGSSDISAVDISNIQIDLNKINRMILPDGYVDISSNSYDLCGNEVVRTCYTYNKDRMFIGYDNLPQLDISSVNHNLDPSYNNILYELDVSGSLYVSNHSQLNDISCNNLVISGNLDMSMNQIIKVADATNNSDVPSWGQVQQEIAANTYWIKTGNNLSYNAGDVSVKDTNLIQESTLTFFTTPIIFPSTFASLVIARVVKTDAITSGYFTIQLTTPNYQQIIHFIAGVVENKTPFIKVLSNINIDILIGFSNLYIVDNGIDYLLCTNFFSFGSPVDYIKLTLSNNSQNYSVPTSNNINWILQDLPLLPSGPTYTKYVDISLNLMGGGPYAITSMYEIIDNSMNINGNLYFFDGSGKDLYLSNDIISTNPQFILDIIANLVDITGSLEVNNKVSIKGNSISNPFSVLDVCGNTVIDGNVVIDSSSNINDGITIKNSGSGGPQLRFQDNNTNFLLQTTYKTIYVDEINDNLNIDIASDDLIINCTNSNLILKNTGSTNSKLNLISTGVGTVLMGLEHSGKNLYLFANSNTCGMEITQGVSGEGIALQASGTPDPYHKWSITNGPSSLAISVKGITSGFNYQNISSGEVIINENKNNIDFLVNTQNIDKAFYVDADDNKTYISTDLDISGNVKIIGKIIDDLDISANLDICGNLTVHNETELLGHLNFIDASGNNLDLTNNLNVDGLITGIADTTFVEYRDFSVDISANSGDAWHCIAITSDSNPTGGNDNARGLFIIDDDTSGVREHIIFYAGHSYARGNYVNVLAHNWYMTAGPLITNIKIDVSGSQPTPGSTEIYAGSNLYIYRKNSNNTSDIHIRLYENGRNPSTGGRWVLTSTPYPNLNTTAVNLDLTYNPNNNRANSCSSLDHSFQGDVSMNSLNVNNLDITNTLTTKVLEVNSGLLGAQDSFKVDSTNKTSTFNFDSGSPNPGYILLKDTNTSNTTFLRQSGSTTILENTDLQVGFGGGVWGDITGGEVTGWFNTRDFYAIAQASTTATSSAPQALGYTQITNTCPGGVEIITTATPQIYIKPPATGVYTITITGIWTGDAWGSGDQFAPILYLEGPAFHSSTPGGANAVLYMDSNPRYYNSGYTNYHTFNWTGRMLNTYNSSQAQYRIFAKNNGSSQFTYNGQIQVTRIC